jgi:chemotaxis protein MotB
MKPNYLRADSSGQRDRWTVSYMDVLTILLIFFVAAAAKTIPPPKPVPSPKKAAERISEPIRAIPQPPLPKRAPDPPSALSKAQKLLEDNGLDAKLEQRGLVISLPQAVLYASGEDGVSQHALPTVEKVAEVLGELPNRVVLIGHADSVPIHNRRFKNNWELSAARGLRLLEVLRNRYHIDETRLSVSSDGANRPASPNDTAEGRANNRRVEIVVVDESADPKQKPPADANRRAVPENGSSRVTPLPL